MIFAEKCRLLRTLPGMSGLCTGSLMALSMLSMQAHATEAIVHDAEYYILESQNGERWAAEDKELDKKLAALEKKYGQPPN
ncbi:MAG: hypothetical protein DRR06_18925, partial [Gammaproteobacteria bacterium]